MTATMRHRPVEVLLPPHGVFVLESHHAPNFRMTSQRHDFLEIFHVLDGEGVFHLAGREHPCRKDDLIVVPVGCVHHIADDPARPLHLYGICVAPSVWQAEPRLLDELPGGPLPVSPAVRRRARDALRRLLFEQTLDRRGARAGIVAQALQLLVALVRGRLDAAPPLRRDDASASRQAVQRYLTELTHRFFEATDLDRTAAELGMSRRRFTQLFREIAGVSWFSHLTRLRIDYARQLLRDPRRSITAAAFACGYEDLSSFYRAFKRYTGQTPNAWRHQPPSGAEGDIEPR